MTALGLWARAVRPGPTLSQAPVTLDAVSNKRSDYGTLADRSGRVNETERSAVDRPLPAGIHVWVRTDDHEVAGLLALASEQMDLRCGPFGPNATGARGEDASGPKNSRPACQLEDRPVHDGATRTWQKRSRRYEPAGDSRSGTTPTRSINGRFGTPWWRECRPASEQTRPGWRRQERIRARRRPLRHTRPWLALPREGR